jgi:hypothetical protein
MPVTNDKFDQLKIDKLKHFLEDMASKGQAKPFEIFVDSLKVVPKTEDPKDFDSYEFYMNEDTEKIRILIYNSNLSPRNDQYCFYVQQNKQEKPLNGLGDLDGIIQEKLNARDKEYELNRLKEELEETKAQLEESEEYADKLEQQLEEAKSNKYKLGKLDLIDFGTLVLGRIAEKNSDLLAKVGLEGLGNNQKQIATSETENTEASFQKKTETPNISAEQLQYIPVLQQLDAAFDKLSLEVVMLILGKFSEDPDILSSVAESLDIPLPSKEK